MGRSLGYKAEDFDKFEWFKVSHAYCVHEGWYTLLYKLCLAIDAELDNIDKKQFKVAQVKQKFGGLRFYIYGGNKVIQDFIREAEQQSYKTCEFCGKKGRARPGRWILTLCTYHWLDCIFGEDSNPRWAVKFGALWDDCVGQVCGVGYLISDYWTRILQRRDK